MNSKMQASIDWAINIWNGECLDCKGTPLYPYPSACELQNGEYKLIIDRFVCYFINDNGEILGSLSPIQMKPFIEQTMFTPVFNFELPKITQF